MMFAALPPSSSVRRLSVPASSRWIAFPTSVEPVNAILSTSGCLTSSAPARPSPVMMLTTPGGSSAWRRTSANSSAESGVVSAGLRTIVPGGQRRRDLPRQHQKREARMIWPATPTGARRCGNAYRACPPSRRSRRNARPPAECRRHGLLDRLAAVQRPPAPRTLASAPGGFARSGRGTSPALPGDGRPAVVAGVPGRLHGEVDIRPLANLGEHLLGRRADGREYPPGPRFDELASDVEAVALLERDDVARLGSRRVVPAGGNRRRSCRSRGHQS